MNVPLAKVDTTIKFGAGWNCCRTNPVKVVVFDEGTRWAVCKGCASVYTGEVQDMPKEWRIGEFVKVPDANYQGQYNYGRIRGITVTVAGPLAHLDMLDNITGGNSDLELLTNLKPLSAYDRRMIGLVKAQAFMIDRETLLPRKNVNIEEIIIHVKALNDLGRTQRWHDAVRTWDGMLRREWGTKDFYWAVVQGSMNCMHACRLTHNRKRAYGLP